MSKSRLVMNVSSYLIATRSSAASSPIASKSPGMSGASEKPSVSSEIKGCIRVEGRAAGKPGRMRKNTFSEESDDSESELWYYRSVAQTDEACGKSLAGETAESILSLQSFTKVKTIKKRHWNTSLPHRHKQSLLRKPSTT